MSKHEAEISPSAMLYRTVAIKKDNIPNSMLSRRPTPYYFDYTVVLHSHPSAIKTFISLNCSHYNRPDRIRQGLLSIFYQNGVWFLCNCVSSGMVSCKFSCILQTKITNSFPFIPLVCRTADPQFSSHRIPVQTLPQSRIPALQMQGFFHLLPAYTFIYPFLNFRHTEFDRLCDFFN